MQMKIMTIFGTRPEIIRLSLISRILDQHCTHITVNTGQNFDENLSDIFFRDLDFRKPDVQLGVRSEEFAGQVSAILSGVDEELKRHSPDRVLLLGDTNSALCSIVAARRGIPVFHMEAGNRCFDDRVPEEVNRRIIDHSSTILLPYTERSRENLIAEGIDRDRIYVTGNPINEVLRSFSDRIEDSPALDDRKVRPFEYFLVTLHRAENVDEAPRLSQIFRGFGEVARKFEKDLLVSVHPRTAARLKEFGIKVEDQRIRLLHPMPFFDFVKLEKNALAVLTDSGTVQEECSIFGVPNVTVRDVTERPETVECGSNIISGAEPDSIVRSVELAISQPSNWVPPREYTIGNTSQIVSKIILAHLSVRKHA